MSFEIKKNIFSSKVARRIFGLFLMSTFIPMFTISIVTYVHISNELEQDAKKELYRESRAQGLNLYDRFLTLKTVLTAENKNITSTDQYRNIGEDDWIKSLFSTLFIIKESGEKELV